MVSPKDFCTTLQRCGTGFFAGVPDSLLKNVCAYITDNISAEENIIAANEGAAIALGAGNYLATGRIPLIYMQNSGIGNAVNPLLSLADPLVYSIPMVLLIGWRGEPGVHDEPQHAKQGLVTLPLLEAMDIPYTILDSDNATAMAQTEAALAHARRESRPYAIVIRKDTFSKYSLEGGCRRELPLSREEALKTVIEALPADSVTVSTTGKLSRELFELREARGEGHEKDFLTVGSMGHACSIALGMALGRKERQIVCLDGDGAFIMHTGALTNIGTSAPANLLHIVFNNGAHESVGGQPTAGFDIDMPSIATACGYRSARRATTAEEIRRETAAALSSGGPALLEIAVGIDSRADLGRPTTTPQQNKEALMAGLGSNN